MPPGSRADGRAYRVRLVPEPKPAARPGDPPPDTSASPRPISAAATHRSATTHWSQARGTSTTATVSLVKAAKQRVPGVRGKAAG